MPTWRDTTFDALARAARAAAGCWDGYARFATLQERGLRKDALREVARFASEMSGREIAARWDFVRWLLDDVLSPGVVLAAVMPFPLKVQVVVPTIREMRQADSAPPEAFLWAALHFGPDLANDSPADSDPIREVLHEGLQRFPDDPRLARALAVHLFEIVKYNSHHLHESLYLGDVEEDRRVLAEARGLLPDREDPMHVELDRAEALLRAWCSYRSEGAHDFIAWCREHDVAPPTGRAYYYDPPPRRLR